VVSVRKQESKNKTLRRQLVAFIRRHYDGRPILGCEIADAVKVELGKAGVLTTSEVLAKELRHAARKGEVTRTHTMRDGRKFVQYSPAGCSAGDHPRVTGASPGSCATGTEPPQTCARIEGQVTLVDPNDLTPPPYRRD